MNNCLQDITDYENKIMKWKSVDNRHDTRIAHLTEESHIILTKLIKEWLKTDEMFFDFDMKEFVQALTFVLSIDDALIRTKESLTDKLNKVITSSEVETARAAALTAIKEIQFQKTNVTFLTIVFHRT